jgi:hypothetical protein
MKIFFTFLIAILCLFSTLTVNASIGWIGTMTPNGGSTSSSNPLAIGCQVYKAGVTEAGGQGAGIICQLYYGEVTAWGGAWTNIQAVPMTYVTDFFNNDVYGIPMTFPTGMFEFKCRASDDGGTTWSYVSGSNAQVLPVELAYIKALPSSFDVRINWQTASERNSKAFEIEHSTDSKTWSMVGSVRGAGNSNLAKNYQFTDNRPAEGINYYRLKQVDFDGNSAYSKVVIATFETQTIVSASPNPFSERLIIRTEGEKGEVVLYDTQGKVVLHQTNTEDEAIECNTSTLPTGIYFAMVRTEDKVTTLKVVKE